LGEEDRALYLLTAQLRIACHLAAYTGDPVKSLTVDGGSACSRRHGRISGLDPVGVLRRAASPDLEDG
jgi:hypothetical protein